MKSVLRRVLCTMVFALLLVGFSLAQDVQTYTVKEGDTLYRIATQHRLSVPELQRLNGLKGTNIRVGQRLVVSGDAQIEAQEVPPPVLPEKVEEKAAADSMVVETFPIDSVAFAFYRIQPGETYYTIARRFGIPADTLWVLNDSLTQPLVPEQVLRLPPRFATVPYTIRSGDTLSKIATQFGISVASMRLLNDLDGDKIVVGQVLLIPSKEAVPQVRAKGLPSVHEKGKVVAYPSTFSGRLMASGKAYDPDRYSVSHRDLPLGAIVILTNPSSQKSTYAEVTDRGPVQDGFMMDVSAAVARALTVGASQETIEVRLIR